MASLAWIGCWNAVFALWTRHGRASPRVRAPWFRCRADEARQEQQARGQERRQSGGAAASHATPAQQHLNPPRVHRSTLAACILDTTNTASCLHQHNRRYISDISDTRSSKDQQSVHTSFGRHLGYQRVDIEHATHLFPIYAPALIVPRKFEDDGEARLQNASCKRRLQRNGLSSVSQVTGW